MKHEIEIPDLPEGWQAVAYRIALRGVDHVLRNGKVTIYNGFSDDENLLIVEKIPPRRIVLEETDEDANCELPQPLTDGSYIGVMVYAHKIWREVKEGE